jgi:hypothetical protein
VGTVIWQIRRRTRVDGVEDWLGKLRLLQTDDCFDETSVFFGKRRRHLDGAVEIYGVSHVGSF